jgi:hypothetical protein
MKLWVALLGAAPLGAFAACSTSSHPTPSDAADASTSDDAAADAADDTADAAADDAACGPPPWVNLGLIVTSLADPDGGFVEGATLTASLCPGVSRTSAKDGTVVAAISKGTPFFPRLEASGFVATRIVEMRFDADKVGISAPLPPKLFTVLIPGWAPDQTTLLVGLNKDGDAGACATLDGVALSVTDHPEAKVTYLSTDTIPAPTTDSVTTASGRALIQGLATGLVVKLAGVKQGCTVDFAKAPYTGNTPTEAGAITLVPGYVR